MTALIREGRSVSARGIGRGVLATVGLLVAATALYILAVPVAPDNFAATAGVDWTAFQAANPDVAPYLVREARLLAIGFLGVGLYTAGLAFVAPRGEGGAGAASWLAPLLLGASAVVFFAGDGADLGAYYGLLALTAAVGAGLMRAGSNVR